MRVYYRQFRAATRENIEHLRRGTPARQLQAISRFLSTGETEIKASNGKTFFFVRDLDQYGDNKAVRILAEHQGVTCGIAYFEIKPVSADIPRLYADFHVLPPNYLKLKNTTPDLNNSAYTLRVSAWHRRQYRGIGTTLLRLSLENIGATKLSFLQALLDVSSSVRHPTSFFEHHGFVLGKEINSALARLELEHRHSHFQHARIFYLNGVLERSHDFLFPPLGIKAR